MKHTRPVAHLLDGHRRFVSTEFDDHPSQAKCRCRLNGCCPKHDPLGYTGDGAAHRTDDSLVRSQVLA